MFTRQKIILIAMLQLCFVALSISQTSIGIKNKNDREPILSYRLPKWGYTTLFINTSGNASNSELERDNKRYYKSNGYDFFISPSIKRYQESERYLRQYDIRVDFSTNYDFSIEYEIFVDGFPP